MRPYYLFQCDEVQGTEHLRTPVETGIKIIEGMRGYTSGLAIPTFVVDLPQGGGKVPCSPTTCCRRAKDELILRNYEGQVFRYRNPRAAGERRIPVADEPVLQGKIAAGMRVSRARSRCESGYRTTLKTLSQPAAEPSRGRPRGIRFPGNGGANSRLPRSPAAMLSSGSAAGGSSCDNILSRAGGHRLQHRRGPGQLPQPRGPGARPCWRCWISLIPAPTRSAWRSAWISR